MNRIRNPGPAEDQVAAVQVLVCFAVREEARFFEPPIRPVTASLITGIGASRASAAIRDYLSNNRPRLVLTCGFAGGLNPAHPLGQVLFDDTQAGPYRSKFSQPEVEPGRFVHSDRVVVSAREKKKLFEATGADAVEMESSTIVAACRERGVPVMILRVISDTATEDLPLDFNRFTRPGGGLNMPRLLRGIARSPSVVPGLIKFRGRLRRAARSLAATLGRFLTSDDLF